MKKGFDILIIKTQNSSQEEFWQKKLRSLSGEICKPNALILAIADDWRGGAGTGLGTLYAYTKAQEKAKFKYHQDIRRMQQEGASVALYNASGIDKELFPLIAAERSSIANLKLPSRKFGLIELVIKQTNQFFSENQEGRLLVFPCNQIFYPSEPLASHSNSHIALYCQGQISNIPGREFISLERSGARVFKTPKPITLNTNAVTAVNLNTFSLSLDFVQALIEECKEEIEKERGQWDADACFWMPLTLDFQTFLSLNPTPEHQLHFHRMAAFKKRFIRQSCSTPFLKTVDIGKNGYRWDFHSTRSYYQTLLKLAEPSLESHLMRQLFEIKSPIDPAHSNCVISDWQSCLIDSKVHGGSIKNSVLIGVEAGTLQVENCVLVNCRLSSLQTQNALLYNVDENKILKLAPGTVRADLQLPYYRKTYRIYSHLDRNGISDWNQVLPQNALSYSTLQQLLIHSP